MKNDYLQLKPAVPKWLLLLVGSVFLLVGGGLTVREGLVISCIMGILGITFGGCGILVSIVALFSRRMVLRLTPEGFGFGTLRKKYFYKWSDIAVFGVGTVAQRMTCFTLRSDYTGEERVRSINRGAIGFDRFLPDTYGKKPMELASLLEEWRYRHSDIKHTEQNESVKVKGPPQE